MNWLGSIQMLPCGVTLAAGADGLELTEKALTSRIGQYFGCTTIEPLLLPQMRAFSVFLVAQSVPQAPMHSASRRLDARAMTSARASSWESSEPVGIRLAVSIAVGAFWYSSIVRYGLAWE